MIKLLFGKDGRYINFFIEKKVITANIEGYNLPYFPMDLLQVKKVAMTSRNKIPASMVLLFQLPKIDVEEFDKAKDDNEQKDILIRDAKKQGAVLIDTQISS